MARREQRISANAKIPLDPSFIRPNLTSEPTFLATGPRDSVPSQMSVILLDLPVINDGLAVSNGTWRQWLACDRMHGSHSHILLTQVDSLIQQGLTHSKDLHGRSSLCGLPGCSVDATNHGSP
ncbi:hypothetical protein KC367_g172 [Hortaea werneckii]|nr:hypothetical protein KC367_g172 [Hortaea werneckii]